jgi:hypothetical protein
MMNEILNMTLSNWTTLTGMLSSLREDQVKILLDEEMGRDKPRAAFVERLHQRYSSLRMRRERDELLATVQGKLA